MIHHCCQNAANLFPAKRIQRNLPIVLGFLVAGWICLTLSNSSAWAQDQDAEKFVRATAVLPESTAGLVRIPNFPKFQKAWKQTSIGRLVDEPSMQPFIEAQRERVEKSMQSLDNKIGIRPEDLADIAAGEVVVAWLPFENDKRRPFTICLIADVRNRRAKAEAVLETIDKDLKAAGWTRKDVEHREQTIRLYDTQPKPGQLKIEQIAIALSDERIIATDRDTVVFGLLDSLAGEADSKSIEQADEFAAVLRRSSEAIQQPILDGGATVSLEWFAKPFEMGRVLREAFQVDRGNQVDVIKLLENQGFDVIRGIGGVVAMNGKKYDLIHRGFILADQSKIEKAAQMLQFANDTLNEIPTWVPGQVASFNRLNLKIKDAFWAAESLVNEAFGDEIFRDIISGIRDDEDGPQIDIEKNVLPNLDDQIILLTDNVEPADIQSERMLMALRVKDGKAIERAIRKAMEVEPDATKLDTLPGIEIWQVQRTDDADDFDEDLFGDLDLDFGEETAEETPPLLEHWAIGLVPAGPSSENAYLMFSSHPEFLIESAKRITNEPVTDRLELSPEAIAVQSAMKDLGVTSPAFDRIVRMKVSLRTKYQLLRQGQLKESDTILGSFYRRIFETQDADEAQELNTAKLPALSEIEEFLPNGGSFFETTESGWSFSGFLLK
ncbi:MAG: membrane or secreted protein [Rubripirellula sp.]|nr:membrane or secreted protein [Rubripirellula sp.]